MCVDCDVYGVEYEEKKMKKTKNQLETEIVSLQNKINQLRSENQELQAVITTARSEKSHKKDAAFGALKAAFVAIEAIPDGV